MSEALLGQKMLLGKRRSSVSKDYWSNCVKIDITGMVEWYIATGLLRPFAQDRLNFGERHTSFDFRVIAFGDGSASTTSDGDTPQNCYQKMLHRKLQNAK